MVQSLKRISLKANSISKPMAATKAYFFLVCLKLFYFKDIQLCNSSLTNNAVSAHVDAPNATLINLVLNGQNISLVFEQ